MKSNTEDNSSSAAVLKNALVWHEQWKETLRGTVDSGAAVDAAIIRRDDCCELGKWIYSDGQRLYWGRPEFQELLLNHREFHMLAGAVAEVLNEKKYELAAAYLSSDTQFVHASNQVRESIRRLESVVDQ